MNEKEPAHARIAQEVSDLLQGDRSKDYGDPFVTHSRIAKFWNARLGYEFFTPRIVAEFMSLLKMARVMQTPDEDSFRDMVGYDLLAADFAERERAVRAAQERVITESHTAFEPRPEEQK